MGKFMKKSLILVTTLLLAVPIKPIFSINAESVDIEEKELKSEFKVIKKEDSELEGVEGKQAITKFNTTSSEPKYVLAKDSDFSGTSNGNFRYIGKDEYVEIPHVIKGVPVTSYSRMFEGTSVKGVKSTNKKVTDMSNMFRNSQATELNLSNLDTSNVTNMSFMFYDASNLTKLDLSNFDTTNVTRMTYMFYGASSLTELDLSNFNTSKVTNMSYMFHGASSLKKLDLSSFDTSKVTDMAFMFFGASSLTELNLSNFDTSNVMSMIAMFYGASSLKKLDLSGFDTSNVTSMSSMFYGASNLTKLDLSNFDTSKVTSMRSMFQNASSLTELDLSNFDTTNVTDMSYMFYGTRSLTKLDLSSFDTSNVTSMSSMFQNASSLTKLDLSNFDTSNVTNMYSMFSGASGLTELDLSNFDTSNVTNMSSMFSGASSLTKLDLSNFDTSNVTTMSSMFYRASNLTKLDLSNFDTSNVTSMRSMFSGASSLTELDLSSFVTTNVTDMSYMFHGAKSLTELDLSNFDTSKVTDMGWMFHSASGLTELDLSSFDTTNVRYMDLMFFGASNLTKGYAQTQKDADKFNTSSGKPEHLHFVVKGTPVITFSENGNSTYKKSHSTKVNVDGSGYSLTSMQYAWSTSASTPTSGWANFSNGQTLSKSTGSGDYYLHIRATSAKNITTNTKTGVFRLDNTPPSLNLTQSPTGYTNGNVTITATGSDSHSGVKRIQKPNGDWVNGSSATHSVSSNGTYSFVVEDNAGNTHTQSITVSNIDKTQPTVSLSNNGGDWSQSHSTRINASDSGSGLNTVQYHWTTNTNFPTSGWTNTSNGATVNAPTSTGNHYLHVRATDNAGNIRQFTSNVFRIDRTAPTLSLSQSPTGYTNGNVTITATGSDSHSGVKRIRLSGGSWITGNSMTHVVSANGTYSFQVEDNAGNTHTQSITINNIDKILPTVSLSTNGGDWSRSHSTTINVSDSGGSGLNTVQYRWTTNTTFPTSGWSNGSNGTTVNAPTTTGNHYLHIRATDNAGNVRQFTSSVFQVDRTAPSMPTISAPSDWVTSNQSVSITPGTDSHSGVARTEYRVNNGSWTIYSNAVSVTENGTTTIQARTIDNAGNVSDVASATVKIDKVNPTLTITSSTTSITHEDVILTVKGADSHSGVKRIKLPNGTWVNGSETSYTVKENGTYEFVVEDNAGNIHIERYTVSNIVKTLEFEGPNIQRSVNVQLEGDMNVGINIGDIVISDWRDGINNWSLKLKATHLEGKSHSLPPGLITFKGIDKIDKLRGNKEGQIHYLSKSAIIDDGQIEIISASNERGEYKVKFSNDALNIYLPVNLVKTGTYNTRLTWTLEATPQSK